MGAISGAVDARRRPGTNLLGLTQAREGTVAGGGGRSRGTANHCGRDRPTAAGAHRAAETGRLGNQRDPSPVPLERADQSLSA